MDNEASVCVLTQVLSGTPAAYAIDDVMQMSFPDAISVISHAVALWEFFFVVVAVLTIGPFYDILL